MLAGAVAVAALLFAGCTDSSKDEADAGAVEPESTGTTTAAGSGEEAADDERSRIAVAVGPILADTGEGLEGPELEAHLARRYEAYWLAFDMAREAPTTEPERDYPELAELAAGEQLEVAYDELRELHATGHAIRAPEAAAIAALDADSGRRVRIERLEIGVAELESCQVNDRVRYVVADDEVLSDSVLTVQAESTMARADGSWKVIRSKASNLDPGVSGCWLEDESLFPY